MGYNNIRKMKGVNMMILVILLVIAVVIAFKILGLLTRAWLKVFAFGVIALIALIVFGAMLF